MCVISCKSLRVFFSSALVHFEMLSFPTLTTNRIRRDNLAWVSLVHGWWRQRYSIWFVDTYRTENEAVSTIFFFNIQIVCRYHLIVQFLLREHQWISNAHGFNFMHNISTIGTETPTKTVQCTPISFDIIIENIMHSQIVSHAQCAMCIAHNISVFSE